MWLSRTRLLEAKAAGYTSVALELKSYVNGINYSMGISAGSATAFWGNTGWQPSNGWETHTFTFSIDTMLAENRDFYYTIYRSYAVNAQLNYYASSHFA